MLACLSPRTILTPQALLHRACSSALPCAQYRRVLGEPGTGVSFRAEATAQLAAVGPLPLTRFRRLHGGDRSSSAHFPESACGHACGRAPHSPPATAAPRPTPLRPRPVAAPRPRGPSGRLSSAAAPSRSPAFSLAVSAAVSGVLPSGRAACVLRASPPAPFAPVRRVSRLLRVPSGGVEAGVTHVGHLETRRAQGGGSYPRCWRAARPRRTSGSQTCTASCQTFSDFSVVRREECCTQAGRPRRSRT
ncbi:uncharacterized protein [Manis javanica]|uniref:uncharacterized protein n=1 Tax=Manis javanica TaxID=9974 RepID=UPI003C6CFBA1